MIDIVERLHALAAIDGCQASLEAVTEITRLRNELHIAQVWSERVIAGHEHDITEITAMRAENERLREALKPILNYPNIKEKIGNQLYDLGCYALGFTPVHNGQPAPGKEEV